ncbi:hypothetical protein KSW81_007058 [Nannochloris sp. 'desiccata']|nr:hypothetical protein KSW81_007058 [Chlorella desiccata (nom. nud.)]
MIPTGQSALDSAKTSSSHVSKNHLTLARLPSFLRLHSAPTPRGDHYIDEDTLWKESAFPQYMQESVDTSDFCSILEEAKARQSGNGTNLGEHKSDSSSVWRTICREAERDAKSEPLLSSFLYASILSHDSFERSLAFVLSNRLSDATLLPTELFEVFYTVLRGNRHIAESAMADLCAVRERASVVIISLLTRDPACESYSQALLYFKGYHAIQVQRIAHSLWHAGRRVMSLALQSRSSEVLAVDIHPAAKIGKGVLLDHGTGVVIGETAEVGNNVSILQNVTLGGTGKQHGDRHPKVSDNVLIGANATILGNIRIGKGAQVAAGSLVLKPVPPKTMVAGSPAKEVGHVSGNPAAKMDQWAEDTPKTGEERTKTSTVKSNITNVRIQEKPCEDLFAAPSISSSKVPMKATVPVDKKGPVPPQPSKAKPSIESTSPHQATASTSSTDASTSGPVSSPEPAAATEAAKTVKEGKEKLVVATTRKGAPPSAAEPVDAVTSDTAAKKKWGAQKAGDDVEYFI